MIATPTDSPRAGRRVLRRRERTPMRPVPFALAIPGIVFLVAFHFVAIGAGAWYAFTDWSGLGTAHFVGLANFRHIFHDPVASAALKHTFELAIPFFVLANVFGLGLAIALNRTLKTRNFLRSVFFLPVAMSSLAVAFVWQYILSYTGALNQFLGFMGLKSWERPWIGDPKWAIWTILVVLVWQYSGLAMVIFLAGLQGIPDEVVEAARVDGAGAWMRFRRVILPFLAPAIVVNATLMTLTGLRVFDQIIALTQGGPVNATETLATQVWEQSFIDANFGYGAALALTLSAFIAGLVLLQMALLRFRRAD